MALKKLEDFINEEIEPNAQGKKLDPRTAKKFPGAIKIAGRWYIDMDDYYRALNVGQKSSNLLNTLMKDKKVAELLGNV